MAAAAAAAAAMALSESPPPCLGPGALMLTKPAFASADEEREAVELWQREHPSLRSSHFGWGVLAPPSTATTPTAEAEAEGAGGAGTERQGLTLFEWSRLVRAQEDCRSVLAALDGG